MSSAQLLPAVVLAIGADAKALAAETASRYPVTIVGVDAETGPVADAALTAAADQVKAALVEQRTAVPAGAGLPAVVVVADTALAAAVATIVSALRTDTTSQRPRVWPTFVAGSVEGLGAFDEQLDELGSGSCDLVLMMNSDAPVADKADALAAWLHVKMPAPPSVLGELPDVNGKICRYVAIGAATTPAAGAPSAGQTPSAGRSSASGTGVAEDLDVSAIGSTVRNQLAGAAQQVAVTTNAVSSAEALSTAASALDAPALIRAENHLADAIRQVATTLPATLTGMIPEFTATAVKESAGRSATTQEAASADAGGAVETSAGATSADGVGDRSAGGLTSDAAAADRTEAVGQLVLMASKGGLSKMFAKSRMAAVAQSISAAATRDVQVAVASALEQAQAQVDESVNQFVESMRQERETELAKQREAVVIASTQDWRDALEQCRQQVKLWSAVDTSGVRRSWGGSAPAPRHYIVGSASALKLLPDEDEALHIVDLTDAGKSTSTAQSGRTSADGEGSGAEIEAALEDRRATVLLAQYGLPLSAFVG